MLVTRCARICAPVDRSIMQSPIKLYIFLIEFVEESLLHGKKGTCFSSPDSPAEACADKLLAVQEKVARATTNTSGRQLPTLPNVG